MDEADAVTIERSVTRLQRRRLAGIAGYLSLASAVGPILLAALLKTLGYHKPASLRLLLILLFSCAAPLLGLLAWRLRVGTLRALATVRASSSGLVVSRGRRELLRVDGSDVMGGFVAPAARAARIELDLSKGRTLVASVPTVRDADRVLQVLGADRARRSARISLASDGRRIGIGILAGLLSFLFIALVVGTFRQGHAALPAWTIGAWIIAETVLTWFCVAATKPAEVVVGDDGIFIERPFRKRYVRYDEIASTTRLHFRLRIDLKDGSRLPISGGAAQDEGRMMALQLRMTEAMAARAHEPLAQAKLALLARQGRSVEAWRRDLEGTVSRGAAYRETPLSADDLATILDSASISAEQRLGAALALVQTGDGGRERVRVAAKRAASPSLRIAFDRIGDAHDDATIEASLLELDAEPSLPTIALRSPPPKRLPT